MRIDRVVPLADAASAHDRDLAAEAVRDKLARLSSTPVQYAVFEQRMLVPAQTLPKKLDFVRIEGTHAPEGAKMLQ